LRCIDHGIVFQALDMCHLAEFRFDVLNAAFDKNIIATAINAGFQLTREKHAAPAPIAALKFRFYLIIFFKFLALYCQGFSSYAVTQGSFAVRGHVSCKRFNDRRFPYKNNGNINVDKLLHGHELT
jgi:hypothetical protein